MSCGNTKTYEFFSYYVSIVQQFNMDALYTLAKVVAQRVVPKYKELYVENFVERFQLFLYYPQQISII